MIELLPLLTILIASLIVALFYLLKERSNDKRKLEQLQNATTELAKQVETEKEGREVAEKLRWQERTGRTTAEKELREFIEKKREEDGGGYNFFPIGTVQSCYVHCQGTPRQPGITPLSKGRIELSPYISYEAFDDLCTFSHIWILFVFHLNTNLNVLEKSKNDHGWTFPAKIRPPRLKGKKTGLFATRTPHRPNPIGLSVVKLERVYVENHKRYIEISNMDLVDGTPVLDIKPYLPSYDYIKDAVVPNWIQVEQDYRDIEFSDEALEQLNQCNNQFKFYTNTESIKQAITEILHVDVSRRPDYLLNHFCFDNLSIYFTVKDNHVTIQKILLMKDDPYANKGHSLLEQSEQNLSPES